MGPSLRAWGSHSPLQRKNCGPRHDENFCRCSRQFFSPLTRLSLEVVRHKAPHLQDTSSSIPGLSGFAVFAASKQPSYHVSSTQDSRGKHRIDLVRRLIDTGGLGTAKSTIHQLGKPRGGELFGQKSSFIDVGGTTASTGPVARPAALEHIERIYILDSTGAAVLRGAGPQSPRQLEISRRVARYERMAMHEGDSDWISPDRLTDDSSPMSSSNGTAIQEPDRRPPDKEAPHTEHFPQKHSSLPTPSPEYHFRHSDARTLTDPSAERYHPLLSQAVFDRQPTPRDLPSDSTVHTSELSTQPDTSPSRPDQPFLFDPVAKPGSFSSQDRYPQDIWQLNDPTPGAILFSTGPAMSKPVGGPPSESDTGPRSPVNGSLWGTPSGLASNLASDSSHGSSASVPQSGSSLETSSLVYTTGHPATNPNTHPPGYAANYSTYNPSNPPYNPSSPRHPGFGAPSNGGSHGQVNTYPSPGSHPYVNYRPSMPYGAYPPYQNTPTYPQYHGSHMGGGYQSMPSGFPGGYSGSSPATAAYPNSPPANTYQGSPVASGYPSPSNAYGMHFPPYGMVSGPPMYAPGTYAPAPYGHPYLPQQGQSDESQGSGMWWFMPAGSGGGSANMQSGGMYGAQPQAQYVPRFAGSQQPPPPAQSHSGSLNPNSPHAQQPSIPGFPSHAAVHSPSTNTLSPIATGSVPSASSPHLIYAPFSGMNIHSPGAAPPPTSGRYPPPLSLPITAQSPTQPPMPTSAAPISPGPRSPTRPMSSSKGGRASAASKAGGAGSRVTSPATRRPWHPNPPVARSEWVMWVGNVPSDATHDELWTFFNQDTTAREPAVTVGSGRTLLHPAPTGPSESGDATAGETAHGVSSVFLISRSNCAFVNYEEEQFLSRAVTFFNGRPLRPNDPRCPRLVCRVRRKDDDLRAGVGGQRGMGLHARWIQEQERRAGEDGPSTSGTGQADVDGVDGVGGVDDPATSPSTYLGPASSSGSSPPALAAADDGPKLPGDVAGVVEREKGTAGARHSGSGSTSSSLLARNFPKRYFILKSLTQFDLNISVERGLWATQAHNESTLDRAFRTSKDVFLIFSANKSGEWFGYARMEGPIIKTQQSVSWESRAPPKSPTSPTVQRKSDAPVSSNTSNATLGVPDGQPSSSNTGTLLSPSENKFAASPAPITPGEAVKLQFATRSSNANTPLPQPLRQDGLTSAPAEMAEAHKLLISPVGERESPDHLRRHTGAAAAIARGTGSFELDETAPFRAARDLSAIGPSQVQEGRTDVDGVVHRDMALTTEELERARGLSEDLALRPIRESFAPAEAGAGTAIDGEKTEGWGKPFKIKWIRTEKLPFHRTRHLRNPWNSDREVKVSRDGTEVEPSVGQRLMDEWDRVVEPESPAAVPSMSRHLPSRPGLQGSTYGSAPQQSKAATRGHASRQL